MNISRIKVGIFSSMKSAPATYISGQSIALLGAETTITARLNVITGWTKVFTATALKVSLFAGGAWPWVSHHGEIISMKQSSASH